MILIENLKKGMGVKFNSETYKVVQFKIWKDGTCRVEIIKGEWNPFFVNLSRLDTI